MKKIILSFVFLHLCHFLFGQNKYREPIYINSLESSIQDDYLNLSFELDFRECKLKKGNSIFIYPVLATASDTLQLPLLLVNGKHAHRAYKRSKIRQLKLNAYIEQEFEKNQTLIPYDLLLTYKPWMSQAQLLIYKADCSCGNLKQRQLILKENISSKPSRTPYVPSAGRSLEVQTSDSLSLSLRELEVVEEQEKARYEQGEAYLHFEQGKSQIRYDIGDNHNKLNQVVSFFNRVVRDRDIEIKGIEVVGYCSIEGTYQRNLQLSHDRAFAFKEWLQWRYPELNNSFYHIQWKGEDWLKLTQLIEQSDYYWKYGALDIIRRYGVFDGRERELMLMQAGKPYRQMYQDLFPQLRRVYYRINYVVRPFALEETSQVLAQEPQKLSVFEMQNLAESYGRDTHKFYETIHRAAEVFPEDHIANTNAAAHAIKQGDLQQAYQLLERLPESAEKYNNLGVWFAVQGAWDKAAYWFKRAIELGSEDANKNYRAIETRLQKRTKKEVQQGSSLRVPF